MTTAIRKLLREFGALSIYSFIHTIQLPSPGDRREKFNCDHFFRSFDVFCFLLLCFDLFIIWVVFWGVNIIYMDCLTLQYCSKTFKFVIRYSLFVIIAALEHDAESDIIYLSNLSLNRFLLRLFIRVVATTPEKTHNQKFLTFETIFNRFFVQF